MKAVLQNMKTGDLSVSEVPPPTLQPGGVLVRVNRSLISLGTERAIIALAKKGPIGKAKDRPDLVRKVMNRARQEGLWNTYQVVKNLISSPIPLGYSCAGEVVAAGREASEFHVGDRVACAGLNFANHAELDYVPRNLAVRIPDAVSFDSACFVALGAIAMQGVRLAEIELGQTVVVLGLGLVGQIAAQLARCAGATVFAFDPEPGKVELALRLGAHRAAGAPDQLAGWVQEATDRHGADAVLVCAATQSDGPLRQAAEVARLKGRVVIVGDVGMHIERRPFFEKELSLVVSRSYGPGRYDPAYEVHGTDYPLPYVRWTERRNMASFLDQIGRGTLAVEPLITQRYPIAEAETAYEIVTGKREVPAIAIVLEYEKEAELTSRIPLAAAPRRPASDTIKLGVIGAGQFAKGILIPEFLRQRGVQIEAVCTASGLTSRHSAENYGARFCTSEPSDVLNDPAIQAVVIATRHDQHASLTQAALAAGKAVFVEKPLALTPESLAQIEATAGATADPRVMVGFNRRFAPLAVKARDFIRARQEPLSMLYRVNAGRLPADSWILDPVTGGGRIIGEVCHFVDLCSFLSGSLPYRVFAEEVKSADERLGDREAVSITIRFLDHSVAIIQYLSNGDPSVAKEYLEVSAAGRTAVLENFRTLSLHAVNRRRRTRLLNQAKGHAEEVAAFVDAVRTGGPMPIDFGSLVSVTRATFMIHQSLGSGLPVDFPDPGEDSV